MTHGREAIGIWYFAPIVSSVGNVAEMVSDQIESRCQRRSRKLCRVSRTKQDSKRSRTPPTKEKKRKKLKKGEVGKTANEAKGYQRNGILKKANKSRSTVNFSSSPHLGPYPIEGLSRCRSSLPKCHRRETDPPKHLLLQPR